MKQVTQLLTTATISATLATLYGCGGSTSAPPTMPTAASGFDCAAVAQFALGDSAKVTRSDKIEANTVRPSGVQTGAFLPAHCLVQGAINSRTGKAFATDATTRAVSIVDAPYAINFELRLPKDWNGRFLFQGGGGLDGVLSEAVGVYDFSQGSAANALSRGFAVVSTDAGHKGANSSDGSFGADPQARLDYAYNVSSLSKYNCLHLLCSL